MSLRGNTNKQLPASRQQERTELTRARFIQSAEKIFARDGFEAAKLEEIAADAGYTRGAFYANFDSKEDLFLAMLEREITSRIENVRRQVGKQSQPARKLQALRDYWVTSALDKRWSLLALEFKLFAVRHPEVRARLAAMHRRLVASGVEIMQQIINALGRKMPASAHAVGVSLFALSSGLTLEHMVDRSVMSEETVRNILLTFFDALTGYEKTS